MSFDDIFYQMSAIICDYFHVKLIFTYAARKNVSPLFEGDIYDSYWETLQKRLNA